MPGETNGNNAVKVGKTNNQLKGSGIGLIASCAWYVMYRVLMSHKNKSYSPGFKRPLASLKEHINKMKERSSSTKNPAIMGSCYRLITESGELYEKLDSLESVSTEEFHSQLGKIIAEFKLQNLQDKIGFLGLLQEGEDFAAIQKAYRDKWSFYGLMNDGDFKQTYVDKAVGELDESVGKGFREGISKYVKSVDEGKNIASRHFEKNIAFQAYCEETDNANRALNVNLINYNGSEPIKISDILQQEKDIGKLNIYCNEKHDIFARREDKKRYYEFKEGAYYQMTSKWPIKDESGRVVLTCAIVMDVSSEGITEITEFSGKGPNGGNCTLSLEEHMELIERNEELYIRGLPLCKAVEKFLGTQRNREEVIRIEKGEECNSALSPGVVPVTNNSEDNSNPSAFSSANSDAPTQTGVNLQGNGVQAEITSQDNGTQEENTEKHSTEAELRKTNVELSALRKEIQILSNGLKNLSVGEKKSGQRTKKSKVQNCKEVSTLVMKRLKEEQSSMRIKIRGITQDLNYIKENRLVGGVNEVMKLIECKEMLKLINQTVVCVKNMQNFILPDGDNGCVTDDDLPSLSDSPYSLSNRRNRLDFSTRCP